MSIHFRICNLEGGEEENRMSESPATIDIRPRNNLNNNFYIHYPKVYSYYPFFIVGNIRQYKLYVHIFNPKLLFSSSLSPVLDLLSRAAGESFFPSPSGENV